jgi:hypothetical protein
MERVLVKTPEEAGAILESSLQGLGRQATLTVADAAAKSGLSLDDAERGLHQLSSTYRGTLSATDQGELLFRFPYGLSLPLTKKPWFQRAVDRAKRAIVGVGKFVVRAWVSIVLVGYAAIFLAMALALMFSGRGEGDRGGGTAIAVIFRVILEALWWTFHPFSPVARRNVWDGSMWGEPQGRRAVRGRRTQQRVVRRFGELVTIEESVDDDEEQEKVPFYEKVNRFVFGPEPEAPLSIEAQKKRLVAQIRVNQGRIGLLDVMKVTGLPREEADPLLSRLLLDYDGEVKVDEHGAITYHFPRLRKTADGERVTAPPPAWATKKEAPPITGNSGGANFLVGAVNAFNLIMATVAISLNMTVDRLIHLFQNWNAKLPVPPLPYDGIPVVLGVIPVIFSILLFALPAIRALRHGSTKKAIAEENARNEVLKTVFQSMESAADGDAKSAVGVREDRLRGAWQRATGAPPDDKELVAAVVALGGDVDVDAMAEGRGLYRFRDLEAEVRALQAQRADADVSEGDVGAVVFASDEVPVARPN